MVFNNELESVWLKLAVAYVKANSQNLLVNTEENQGKTRDKNRYSDPEWRWPPLYHTSVDLCCQPYFLVFLLY
jgi:hypothetical protein